MRRRHLVAAAFTAALVLAPPAGAATMTNAGGTLRFVAGAGKAMCCRSTSCSAPC